MTRRRARVSDVSIPLGLAGILVLAWIWGWRVAAVGVLAGAIIGAVGVAALTPWRQRPRGTTMDVGVRPLLLHLYSPY